MYFYSGLIMAFIVGVASGLKNCSNDCIDINNCQHAVRDVMVENKSDAIIARLQNAYCGSDKYSKIKVCCSDFDNVNHPNANLLPAECGEYADTRIAGGEDTRLDEFPWIVLIAYGTHSKKALFDCSGTLINSRYVLTAAHCIKEKSISFVRVGEWNIETEEDCIEYPDEKLCESYIQDIVVSHTILHPKYSKALGENHDIGLLRLDSPVNLTVQNAGTICLPLQNIPDEEIFGQYATVAGWGQTNTNEKSNILQKATLPILSHETCNSHYGRNDPVKFETQWQYKLCAGGNGKDTCKGDSGGPLMLEGLHFSSYKYIQLGVVSHGEHICGSGESGVYTDVRKHMEWILDTIKP